MQDQRDERIPTYQGRRLPRPDEEVVDQGLGFDLATLLDRRQLLRALGAGFTAAGLAACGSEADGEPAPSSAPSSPPSATATTAASGEIPEETAGPFPGDGSNGPDVLEQSGIVRSDIRAGFGSATGTADGVPMTLELIVQNAGDAGAPLAAAAVYVWHCDRLGRYSLYSDGVEQENFLRGVQIADAAGRVRFTSIFPACYPGRWPHVHFEVYRDEASITDAANVIATSQVALPAQACRSAYAQPGYEASVTTLSRISLANDIVFRDDAGVRQLGTVTGDVAGGYTVSLVVPVDSNTAPSGGGLTGDGAPRGAPGR